MSNKQVWSNKTIMSKYNGSLIIHNAYCLPPLVSLSFHLLELLTCYLSLRRFLELKSAYKILKDASHYQ